MIRRPGRAWQARPCADPTKVSFPCVILEESLRIQRGHTTGACGCHGLTIDRIGHIACGEHAVDARGGRVAACTAAHRDIAVVHLELAFDHDLIVTYAVARLRAKVTYSPIAHAFLPEEFSLAELRRAYEAILNRALDPSNFRRTVLGQGTVEDTGQRMRGTAHRPPKLYRSAPHSSRYTLTIEENP